MITDNQVRKLKKYLSRGKSLGDAAIRADMDEKTARKYRDLDMLPSEIKSSRSRDWRTRPDPFFEIWEEVKPYLSVNPGLEAKTVFSHLQREYPGRFDDGQLRTFQRRVKIWRASEVHTGRCFSRRFILPAFWVNPISPIWENLALP